jgi:phosphopantetheine adenylyltransferase
LQTWLGGFMIATRQIKSSLSADRQKVIERLNVIEKELYDELSNLKKVSISKLEQEARKIQNAEDVVKSYKEHVDFEKEHGNCHSRYHDILISTDIKFITVIKALNEFFLVLFFPDQVCIFSESSCFCA